MNRQCASNDGAAQRRHGDKSPTLEAAGRRSLRRRPRLLTLVIGAALALTMSLLGSSEVQAQRLHQISAQKRSMTVPVFIGKSEDVRTDTSFTGRVIPPVNANTDNPVK